MPHLLARLCLALACTTTIACEDEGPDTTTTEAKTDTGDTDDTAGDDDSTSAPGTASVASTLAPPPGDSGDEPTTGSGGEDSTGSTGEDTGPTTIGPKDSQIGDVH